MNDSQTMRKVEIIVNEGICQVRWMGVTYAKLLGSAALLSLVTFTEFELLYGVFRSIAGENNEYWSPGKMAMTGIIMIAGFHLLGKEKADGFIARLVRQATPPLIVLYLVGLGLLLAGVISLDTIGILLSNPADIVIGLVATDASDQPWLSSLFQLLINPAALLIFSLGIGGLAIVNMFVAGELIHGLKTTIRKIRDTKFEAGRLHAAYETLKRCCKVHRDAQSAIADLTLWSQSRLIDETALLICNVIQEALSPHKRFIKGHEVAPEPGPVALTDPVDPKVIEREVKKIDAWDFKTVRRFLKSNVTPEE